MEVEVFTFKDLSATFQVPHHFLVSFRQDDNVGVDVERVGKSAESMAALLRVFNREVPAVVSDAWNGALRDDQ